MKKATPWRIQPTIPIVCAVSRHFSLFSYLLNLIFNQLILWNSTLLDFHKISHLSSIDNDHFEGNQLETQKIFAFETVHY